MSDHYKKHPTGIECRTIAEHFSYNVGVAMAYLWRHQHKGQPISDLLKAVEHIKFEIERIDVVKMDLKDMPEGWDDFSDDVDPGSRK